MKHTYIYSTLVATIVLLATAACSPEKGDDANKFALSDESLTITEGETAIIEVRGGTDFEITTDNAYASCTKNSDATISVTGVKVGTCTLTVTKGSESLTCSITIARSAAQKDFTIIATPRVENWLPQTVNTESATGLQVTREQGIDASGWDGTSTTVTYGFYYTETGRFLRLSAEGDFTARGQLANGIIAIRESETSPVQYILCESVTIEKVNSGKVWIIATSAQRADLRIVTEAF